MAPKREEKTTGELVQEVPEEDEIAEIIEVQFPGTPDLRAHSLGKAEMDFNSRSQQTG